MQTTSLKDSLLRDLCTTFYLAPFVVGEYRGKNMYVFKFFDYLIIRGFFNILNDTIEINDYGELNIYKEKLYITVIEDTDGCLFMQSLTYKAKPTSCFMVAKGIKSFLERHSMWNDADKVFDFKKKKAISGQRVGNDRELVISVFNATHIALYKPL